MHVYSGAPLYLGMDYAKATGLRFEGRDTRKGKAGFCFKDSFHHVKFLTYSEIEKHLKSLKAG